MSNIDAFNGAETGAAKETQHGIDNNGDVEMVQYAISREVV